MKLTATLSILIITTAFTVNEPPMVAEAFMKYVLLSIAAAERLFVTVDRSRCCAAR